VKSIKFIIIGLLLPINLLAQITFAEQKVEKPGWEYLRDVIFAPYDSSHIHIQVYPLWEAYKKYIGQRLFFLKLKKGDSPSRVKVNRGGEISRMKEEDMIYKYYDIVDVVCVKNSVFSNDISSDSYYYRYFPEGKTRRTDEVSVIVGDDNLPCFILKDTQSGDITYLFIKGGSSSSFIILVGGFLKYKEKFIGQDFVHYKDGRIIDGSYSEIESIWQCIDVLVATDDFFSSGYIEPKVEKKKNYERRDETPAFVLRNKKDTTIIGNLEVKRLISAIRIGNYPDGSGWTTKQSFQIYENKLKKIRLQSAQKEEQKRRGLIAKYGTATADKILAGRYEIGMSKAACKEIAGYAHITDKTAITETWQIGSIWIGGVTYLYFAGDKLVRIVNL
jgi:hypothetical protein